MFIRRSGELTKMKKKIFEPNRTTFDIGARHVSAHIVFLFLSLFLRFPPSDEKQKPFFLCVVNTIIFILIENDEKRIFHLFISLERKNCEKSETIFPVISLPKLAKQWKNSICADCLCDIKKKS